MKTIRPKWTTVLPRYVTKKDRERITQMWDYRYALTFSCPSHQCVIVMTRSGMSTSGHRLYDILTHEFLHAWLAGLRGEDRSYRRLLRGRERSSDPDGLHSVIELIEYGCKTKAWNRIHERAATGVAA
jgi:hypothetical protein